MFEKGNKVQLKRGGPVMTVRRVGDFRPVSANGVDCVWFDEKHKRCSAIFDAAILAPARQRQPVRDPTDTTTSSGGSRTS